MRSSTVGESRLRELLSGPLLRDCRPMIEAGEDSRDPTKTMDTKEQRRADLARTMQDPVELAAWPLAQEMIAVLSVQEPQLFQTALLAEQGTETLTQLLAQRSAKLAAAKAEAKRNNTDLPREYNLANEPNEALEANYQVGSSKLDVLRDSLNSRIGMTAQLRWKIVYDITARDKDAGIDPCAVGEGFTANLPDVGGR